MLNFIAIGDRRRGRQRAARHAGFTSPMTDDVGNAALPMILGRNGHVGIVLALLARVRSGCFSSG